MERIKSIVKADRRAYLEAKERWDSIAKPLGGLGLLEEAIERIAAVQGTPDIDISVRRAAVMCADSGAVSEGITQSPMEVTAVCAVEIARQKASVNKLAEVYNASVTAFDVGIARDVNETELVNKKIAYGSENFTRSRAMTREQAERSLTVGMDIVRDFKRDGVRLIISGEMGIGNTASASAIASVMLSLEPKTVTGRGAGLDNAGLKRKIDAIEKAITLHRPNRDDPIDVLSCVGGFDIGAMAGLFLGGAVYKIPVIIDGAISAAAAYLAYKISPISAEYMLASHASSETASRLFLDAVGVKPIINAELHLGEGTGGMLLLPLLDGALAVYNGAHRFDEIGIERYKETGYEKSIEKHQN